MYEALTSKDSKLGDNIGFNLAYNTPLAIFPWLHQPSNAYARELFDRAMDGVQSLAPPELGLAGTSVIADQVL